MVILTIGFLNKAGYQTLISGGGGERWEGAWWTSHKDKRLEDSELEDYDHEAAGERIASMLEGLK